MLNLTLPYPPPSSLLPPPLLVAPLRQLHILKR